MKSSDIEALTAAATAVSDATAAYEAALQKLEEAQAAFDAKVAAIRKAAPSPSAWGRSVDSLVGHRTADPSRLENRLHHLPDEARLREKASPRLGKDSTVKQMLEQDEARIALAKLGRDEDATPAHRASAAANL